MRDLTVSFEVLYFVPKYGDHQRGYLFDFGSGGITRLMEYSNLGALYQAGRLCIPIDPITAIAMGLVTAQELNLPPGLQAAFNLLK